MRARAFGFGGGLVLALVPALAFGACVGKGRITRVVNNTASSVTLSVAPSDSSAPIVWFASSDPLTMKTVKNAQAKEMIVEVTGEKATCVDLAPGAVSGGVVQGIVKISQPRP